jgi:serine/threonine protein phosphatase PrpC
MVAILSVGWATDRGAVRQFNEDQVFAGNRVVAVADGMGGHAAGDVASAMAAEAMAQLDSRTDELRPDDVVNALARANDAIVAAAADQPQRRGMGTTIAGVALVQVGGSPHWAVFNVGDSRVYRFFDDELVRATIDHSEVEELVMSGRITPEEARVHPDRNVITRSLGTVPAPQVDIWVTPPEPGERFLVCSDGLVTEVADEELGEILRHHPEPAEATAQLLRLALERGARDNVSVAVVTLSATGPEADAQPTLATTLPRGRLGKAEG